MEAALKEQADLAEQELEKAKSRLDDAVKAVVMAGPAAAHLVQDYQLAQQVDFHRTKTIHALSNLGCTLLPQWGEGCDGSGPLPAAAQAWLTAISQLRTDADAVLPQE
jgi:hypothetical protein